MSAVIELKPQGRIELECVLAQQVDSRSYQRALALLFLDAGDSVAEVAEGLRVSRQTVYNWADRWRHRDHLSPVERLRDAPRSGRPATARELLEYRIGTLIETDPRKSGYRSTVWTAALLRGHLRQKHRQSVSLRTIGAVLARLGLRWKHPRHTLARRDPFWRQAKGGSNAASGRGPARWCSCWMRRSSPKPHPSTAVMAGSVNRSACPSPATGPSG